MLPCVEVEVVSLLDKVCSSSRTIEVQWNFEVFHKVFGVSKQFFTRSHLWLSSNQECSISADAAKVKGHHVRGLLQYSGTGSQSESEATVPAEIMTSPGMLYMGCQPGG